MQANHFNIAVLVFIFASVFSQETPQNRKPYAAGRFYTDKQDELETQLQQLFSNAIQKKSERNPLAIVVPHAGYVYSGGVAASGYNQIDPSRKFERIFIIGSSHTSNFPGASVYCEGNFETPLGTVKVDLELAKQLVKKYDLLTSDSDPHKFEHSIEVQLPFLQKHLKSDIRIVPVIIGSSTVETAQKLAVIFKPYLNEKNLFVISSDFSHYPNYDNACMADQSTAIAIQSNKASNLIATLDANKKKNIPGLATSLCGWSSVLTLLYMTEQMPGINVELIQYKNSGNSSFGDVDRVVGYWAITFCQHQTKNQTAEFSLTHDDKKELLSLARESLSAYIRGAELPEASPFKLNPVLKTQTGAFVTLTKNGHLRGCIGHFDANLPLWKVVRQMAIASATQDSRFNKVQASEIKELKIEISVLTPLRRIQTADEFILGTHGIYIRKGNSSGTFLPQVATQTGWTKEEFLGHCARDKAGIGWDEWKTAELYTYEAMVFGEGD